MGSEQPDDTIRVYDLVDEFGNFDWNVLKISY